MRQLASALQNNLCDFSLSCFPAFTWLQLDGLAPVAYLHLLSRKSKAIRRCASPLCWVCLPAAQAGAAVTQKLMFEKPTQVRAHAALRPWLTSLGFPAVLQVCGCVGPAARKDHPQLPGRSEGAARGGRRAAAVSDPVFAVCWLATCSSSSSLHTLPDRAPAPHRLQCCGCPHRAAPATPCTNVIKVMPFDCQAGAIPRLCACTCAATL